MERYTVTTDEMHATAVMSCSSRWNCVKTRTVLPRDADCSVQRVGKKEFIYMEGPNDETVLLT